MLLINKAGAGTHVVPVLGAMLPESGHKFAVLDTKAELLGNDRVLYEVEVYRAYHNPSELVAVGYRLDGHEKFLFDSTGKLIPSRKDDPYIGRLWLMQVRETPY